MDTFVSLAQGLKELALGIAALVGAYIAWRGVDGWRQQMRGKIDHDVGIALLRSVFRLREAIALVRHPMMERAEMDAALTAKGQEPNAEEAHRDFHRRGQLAAYEVRWKGIAEAMSELETARIDAEALWGADASDRVKELRRLVGRLRWAVSTQLQGHEYTAQLSKDQRAEIMRVMYVGRDPDEYAAELEAVVSKIEDYVRPRIAA